MKAFALPDFDHAPALTDLELPEPNQGEVRVRVRAASVNGFDLAVANGFLKGAMEHHFPVVLGKDFAGEVDALGADVEGYSIGDRVFGVVTKPSLGAGALGEYVTVSTTVGLAHLPEGIDFIEGASLGLAGTAAVDAFDAAHLTSGSTVLIAGATGGVGQQALQLAVRAGATVVATASSPEEIDLVTRLGAAQTIDYRGDVAAQTAALYPQGVDAVLHFAGEPAALVPAVKAGGNFVSTLVQSPEALATDDVNVAPIYASPSPETLARLALNQDQKTTAVTVQRVYALSEAGQAFADFSAGTLGKLVITLG